MRVDKSDAASLELMTFDHMLHFHVIGNRQTRQVAQHDEDERAVLQRPEGELADDVVMANDSLFFERLNERRVRPPKMIDPDRGVDEVQGDD